MQKQNRIQKLITFSPRLYELAKERAARVGLSFPEYIRHLIASEMREEELPMVDEEMEKRIGESLQDLEKGNYTIINPGDTKALNKALGITD